MSEPTTPRRSRRGQPVVVDDRFASPPPTASADVVPSRLLHSRQSHPSDLLYNEDPDNTPVDTYRTHFYHAFSRKSGRQPSTRAPTRTYGKVARPCRSDPDASDVFTVGDTVLIRASATSKIPSVAVIMAIWKVEGDDLPPNAPLRVLVHWFVRPNELPKHRVQRDFCENEVLYHLSGTGVLATSFILAPCTVSSSSSSAVRASATISSVAKVSHTAFFCRTAVNPQRGIYYELNWDAFREGAIQAVPSDDNVLERNAITGVPWPNEELWTVKPAQEATRRRMYAESDDEHAERRTKARGRGGPRKRRRVDHPQSESDANSGDEFQAPPASGSEDEDGSEGGPSEDEADNRDNHVEDDEPASAAVPQTPSRRGHGGKRKRAIPPTPRTPKTPRRPRARTDKAQPTPHSKAALRRRKKTVLAVRPPPPAEGTLELALASGLEGDAWLRAMHVLHVAARPGALPCREEEYGRVLRAVEELLEEGSGGCIYISGVPGTGKTATVHAVVRELKRMAEQNEANPFEYVEINGLKIPEPAAAYGLLWVAVCGHDAARDGHMKVSVKEALRNLSKHFASAGREQVGPMGGHACVVLMDELDQLMTTKQDVVYNFLELRRECTDTRCLFQGRATRGKTAGETNTDSGMALGAWCMVHDTEGHGIQGWIAPREMALGGDLGGEERRS